jgi:uncharacterized protein YdaL
MRQGLAVLFLVACLDTGLAAETKCVRIYYDRVPDAKPTYHFGRVHALFLQNLLGHFPNVQQHVIPIQRYRPGDIDRSFATIYLGTYYNNDVPAAFYQDFARTSRNVLWAGYGIWKYQPEELRKLWGVEYSHLSKLDTGSRDEHGHLGFFKFYEYQGEQFTKFSQRHPDDPNRLVAAFEIAVLNVVRQDPEVEVVAWARHSTNGKRVPYVLRNNNRWYIGDSPFSFATEEDRYLIFADLLFDILDEPPRHTGKRPAVFRIEDVHSEIPLWQLYTLTDLLDRKQVPFAMSVIPIFSDPHGIDKDDVARRLAVMSQDALFVDYVKYAKQRGASFIYHGVTHQSGTMRNPFSGLSGEDFEFWDRVRNKPMPDDRPEVVIRRLEDGLEILEESGIRPIAWLTPHYQASPLDYVLFGQLFTWNVGRIIYFPFTARQARRLPESLTMDLAGSEANGQRLAWFEDLQFRYAEELLPSGQFLPYEVFGDVYGQRIIPENVGNIQPYLNEQVLRTETVDDMIRILRRNRVLRDAWGSFFVHPFRLSRRADEGIGRFPGDTKELERLIDAARAYGYEFIDLTEFTAKYRHLRRPAPIEQFLE